MQCTNLKFKDIKNKICDNCAQEGKTNLRNISLLDVDKRYMNERSLIHLGVNALPRTSYLESIRKHRVELREVYASQD